MALSREQQERLQKLQKELQTRNNTVSIIKYKKDLYQWLAQKNNVDGINFIEKERKEINANKIRAKNHQDELNEQLEAARKSKNAEQAENIKKEMDQNEQNIEYFNQMENALREVEEKYVNMPNNKITEECNDQVSNLERRLDEENKAYNAAETEYNTLQKQENLNIPEKSPESLVTVNSTPDSKDLSGGIIVREKYNEKITLGTITQPKASNLEFSMPPGTTITDENKAKIAEAIGKAKLDAANEVANKAGMQMIKNKNGHYELHDKNGLRVSDPQILKEFDTQVRQTLANKGEISVENTTYTIKFRAPEPAPQPKHKNEEQEVAKQEQKSMPAAQVTKT